MFDLIDTNDDFKLIDRLVITSNILSLKFIIIKNIKKSGKIAFFKKLKRGNKMFDFDRNKWGF